MLYLYLGFSLPRPTHGMVMISCISFLSVQIGVLLEGTEAAVQRIGRKNYKDDTLKLKSKLNEGFKKIKKNSKINLTSSHLSISCQWSS